MNNDQLKSFIEQVIGGFDLDVSADVKRELDLRIPIITKVTTDLNSRVAKLEARLAALEGKTTQQQSAPTVGRIDAIRAAAQRTAPARRPIEVETDDDEKSVDAKPVAPAAKPAGATKLMVKLGGAK